MTNWRDSVDKTLKDHLELQIKEAAKYSEAYGKAKNQGQAQLWIAVSNLSREIFNLELKIKFLEGALKDMTSELRRLREEREQEKEQQKSIEPITSELNFNSEIPEISVEKQVKVRRISKKSVKGRAKKVKVAKKPKKATKKQNKIRKAKTSNLPAQMTNSEIMESQPDVQIEQRETITERRRIISKSPQRRGRPRKR